MNDNHTGMVASYKAIRIAIGIVGMILPVLVLFGAILSGIEAQTSISAYYWTTSRDVLVGTLIVAGVLLLTYKGYDLGDRRITSAAGIAAFGIALFPTFNTPEAVGFFQLNGTPTHYLHVIFSLGFFALLAVMSTFQFTLGRNLIRNKLYRICGIVIFASIGLLVVMTLVAPEIMDNLKLVYIAETVMLIAFGLSWLVKG